MPRPGTGPRLLRVALAAALWGACSLTPIPDLSSEWVEPCDPQLRRCPVEFRLQAGNEKTVELRGDFQDGGWTAGLPMERGADAWTATLPLGWGQAVQYKFYVDGSRWLLDPANPRSVPDGKGNTNSLLENVTCAKWSCVAP